MSILKANTEVKLIYKNLLIKLLQGLHNNDKNCWHDWEHMKSFTGWTSIVKKYVKILNFSEILIFF